MTALLDAADRQRAVFERGRNVIVEASAGTGKTQLVVERLVELVAPADGSDAIPIDRVAAITFTRKAAGELRVRVRQRLLQLLADLPPSHPRATALQHALGGVDTAEIGTIHSFSDRMLRRWPVEAGLDPRYTLVDALSPLLAEVFDVLADASERRDLADRLGDDPSAARADEAMATFRDAQRAGLQRRSREGEHWTYHGLDGLVSGFVLQRDVDVRDPEVADLDRDALWRAGDDLLVWTAGPFAPSTGARWFGELNALVRRLRDEPDPVVLFRELVAWVEAGPLRKASRKPRRGEDFESDTAAWNAWKAFDGDTRKHPVRDGALRDELLAPLQRWMAERLLRLRPVVLALYERVKARERVVDHVDLLVRLRNLLRDRLDIRAASQSRFDHIFVDELQDTDPLQAEILAFLCEQHARALRWDAVMLAPGRLTIVGDPKQSIYRFRRADIAMYQRLVELVERSPHLAIRLTSSFRSAPALVGWLNDRFEEILGSAADRPRFRPETGEVAHQPLSAGRASGSDPTVHAVAVEAIGDDADACRLAEADVLARYVRWLIKVERVTVVDRESAESRVARYGDVGVLAVTTTHLPVLFAAFDRDGVPYSARGGSLFLADPVQRRFLLGLCALADRDDGVALAALLRPPFFALELSDLARSRRDDPADRATQARSIVRELRRDRFSRAPGATARALLERTGIARTIALGPNGAQRVQALRELCFQIERIALERLLDFDATVEHVRTWITHPIQLDRPSPVGSDAVRVSTIHQAKGLEFPIVVLWDARAGWDERVSYEPWTVDRDGAGWAIRLDGLRWEEPPGLATAERERAMRGAERKRLVYVAATRARDLLVIPRVGEPDSRWICGRLLSGGPSPTLVQQPVHRAAAPAAWYLAAAAVTTPMTCTTTSRDVELRAEWNDAAMAATHARLSPVAFTDAGNPRAFWSKPSRFGRQFGDTVHIAIAAVLQDGLTAEHALRAAVSRTGLTEHLEAAIADVNRGLATLADLGPLTSVRVEYPVTGMSEAGDVSAGYIDFVAITASGAVVLDFKTDAVPEAGAILPARYVEQVRGYARVIGTALGRAIRAGLLFTADGSIRWLAGEA